MYVISNVRSFVNENKYIIFDKQSRRLNNNQESSHSEWKEYEGFV